MCPSGHRLGIDRAWCFDCHEWCYDIVDARCVRAEQARLLDVVNMLRKVLQDYPLPLALMAIQEGTVESSNAWVEELRAWQEQRLAALGYTREHDATQADRTPDGSAPGLQ